MSEQLLSDHPLCQQEQEPDQIDMMYEDELRAYVRQLVTAITNLSYVIRRMGEVTDNTISRAEILEARQLVGLES